MDAVNARSDALLSQHPHWRAQQPTGAAPASLVGLGGRGMIGHGPRSIMDGDNITPETSRGWGEFLTDAARGE